MTSNLYLGLKDFADMMFMLHFLQPDDVFVDVGANHGVYSLLASGLAGAQSIAYEPIPDTYGRLLHNVELNRLEARVKCINKALGEKEGSLCFSSKGKDGLSHVASSDHSDAASSIEVPVTTLDAMQERQAARMMKMDIEGYEWHALQGASGLLESSNLMAIILEFNIHAGRYGISPEKIETLLRQRGYEPYLYDPFSRELNPAPFNTNGNSLWIKNVDKVALILRDARSFSIYGHTI